MEFHIAIHECCAHSNRSLAQKFKSLNPMPTVFTKLTPMVIPDNFKWDKMMYHLTYKGYITKAKLFEAILRATSTKVIAYSIVVEDTSTTVNGVFIQGYIHTHFAVIFDARLGLTGSRKFDVFVDDPDDATLPVQQVHPHVQPKLKMVQMEALFTQYHRGRKFSEKTGKIEFTEPVFFDQLTPPAWDWTREFNASVIEPPDLVEACCVAEIRPRSVCDIKMLRDEASALSRKRFKHLYDPASFKPLLSADWKVVWAYGASGLGKTKGMCAQLNNPCFVKPFDSVGCLENLARTFDANMHDGIILDEVDLKWMSRAAVIALFDLDEPATLDVRYKSFSLPAGVRKILISNGNPNSLLPADPYGAIARRYTTIHITEPTWHVSPAVQQGHGIHLTPHTQ